ncbi:MAG: iron dependent repressor, metal binding and dimerization domain protein [Bacillota bacterium]|nr:iron dependent repressor, metal binding and dimerization domain protein [Bacillota bacterium]
MNERQGFYTMKGYSLQQSSPLTNAMEDYLEMMVRLTLAGQPIRVNNLSKLLHVRSSSVTKMVRQLAAAGYLQAEKYGDIILTDKGLQAGNYLLYRHAVLQRFLCYLNHSEDELEQVEKIEHFLAPRTIKNLELLLKRLEEDTAE